jgi:hypothetical protein
MAVLILGRRRYLNHNRVPALLFDPVAGVGQENKCTSNRVLSLARWFSSFKCSLYFSLSKHKRDPIIAFNQEK